MDKKICIVTPDIVGPMKNGGIGTACYWLALFLASRGYKVSVLYTGPFTFTAVEESKALYLKHQVEFLAMQEVCGKAPPYYGIAGPGVTSDQIYHYLKRQSYNVVHFQDWQGDGFASIQAKRLGVAFANTKLVVAIHSPSRWSREAMQLWARDAVGDLKLDYMERYAIEHADAVWAPSEAMFNWIASKGYRTAEKKRLIRYLIRTDVTPEKAPASYAAKDPSHLVFFGRLETRKGLELFTEAITYILKSGKDHGIKRITFLGKIGEAQSGVNSMYYLKPIIEDWQARGLTIKVVDDFDAFQAIRFIKKVGAIAVMPSMLDNYPYTVLECLENEIPFLTSSMGGMPEMVSPEAIFDTNRKSLVEAITTRVERTNAIRNLYSSNQTQKDWIDYTEELCAPPTQPDVAENPAVTVCIAYFNYGKFLPQLLTSLRNNDYKNFEVLVVNDGSTDPYSIEVFGKMRDEYSPRGWRFLEKADEGVRKGRNFAVSHARTEYIIFMDPDNVAKPHMISTFMKAMATAKLDVITCEAQGFNGDAMPDEKTPITTIFRPVGPVLELSILENVFGDTNACVRKAAFESIGGYKTTGETSHDDWELWASMCLNGCTLDVIPEPLFYYRNHQQNLTKRINYVSLHKALLETYFKNQKSLSMESIIQHLLIPLHYQKNK